MNFRKDNIGVDVMSLLREIRGTVDVSEVKELLLSLLYLKYINDISCDKEINIRIPESARWEVLSNSRLYYDDTLNRVFSELEEENEILQGIFTTLDFNKFDTTYLRDIINLISSFDFRERGFLFGDFFDAILYDIGRAEGRKGGFSLQPKKLTSLMVSLLPDKENLSVYNPFAGLGSFALNLPKASIYYGQELNYKTCSIGRLRLLAHNLNYKLVCQNSIDYRQGDMNKSFDAIIATPPLGVKINRELHNDFTNHRTVEAFVLAKCMDMLSSSNKTCKAIIAVTSGVLFRGGTEMRLREELIQKDLVDSIISLPSNILFGTSVPLAIIVLNNEKYRKGEIRFIDASRCFTEVSRFERKLDSELIKRLTRLEENDSLVRFISNEEIVDNDYNFNVPRYFAPTLKEKNGFQLVPLGDLLEINNSKRVQRVTSGRMIRVGDLAMDSLSFKKHFNGLNASSISKSVSTMSSGNLLLSLIGDSLKPTYFISNPNTLYYMPSQIVACSINEQLVNVHYLVYELNKKYVREQLYSYRVGSLLKLLPKKDLFRVKINLPSLEEQQSIVQGVKESLIYSKEKELEALKKINGVKSSIYDQNAFLRHSIAGSLGNVRFFFNELKTLLENKIGQGDIISFDCRLSENDESLREILEILDKDIICISEETRKSGRSDEDVDLFSLKELDLYKELKNFTRNRRVLNGEIIFNPDHDQLRECGYELPIKANSSSLTKLLDNLVINVEKHAFVIGKDNKLQISIGIDFDHGMILLGVSNTGKGFAENFDKAKYIRKGSVSGRNGGEGYGGFLINQIVDDLGGEFDFLSNIEDTEYITEFNFKFPLYKNE